MFRIYVLDAHNLPATLVGRVMMMMPDVDYYAHKTPKLSVVGVSVKPPVSKR